MRPGLGGLPSCHSTGKGTPLEFVIIAECLPICKEKTVTKFFHILCQFYKILLCISGQVHQGRWAPSPAFSPLAGGADGDSLDWKEISASEITQRVTSKAAPGSIVLFHNAALHTPEALPAILETLLQEGYTFVPISQLILPQPYTIDHTGRQFADASPSPQPTV